MKRITDGPKDNVDSTIAAAFGLTTAHDCDILSYGDRDDNQPLPGALTYMVLLDPNEDDSKPKLPWLTKIGKLLDTG